MINPQQNYQNLEDLGYAISLISIVLVIQSSTIKTTQKNRKSQKKAKNIFTISVFMSVCSNFVDLAAAKKAYDNLLSKKNQVTKKELSITKDILTGSLLSTIGSLYLLKAILRSSGEITNDLPLISG